MRIYYGLLACALALLLIPGDAFTQIPGGGRRGGGARGGRGGNRGGGFGRGQFDPGQFFDRIANGKSEIVIADANPRVQGMLARIAQNAGVTNGKLTRDQYVAGSQQMMAQFGGGGGGRGRGAGPNGSAGTDGQIDQLAEAEFKRLDKNADGVLNQDEMSADLKAEWQQWDANKNGTIELAEFKSFYANKMKQRQNQLGGDANAAIIIAATEEPEEKKPPVYRAGNLPPGMPAWFAQLDTDGDGQIGLYEWKASGRPIEDFLAMDRNKDGFLTIAEVMRAQPASRGGARGGTAVASANPTGFQPPTGRMNFQMPRGNGTGPQGQVNRNNRQGRGRANFGQ